MAKFDADSLIESALDEIDEAIAQIDLRIAKVQPLIDKKTQLVAARRALVGGTNRLTGGVSGTRLRQEDVVAAMELHKGYSVPALAQLLNAGAEQVRGHLNRGRDERFIQFEGHWYLRDPEQGISSADDLEDREEDE